MLSKDKLNYILKEPAQVSTLGREDVKHLLRSVGEVFAGEPKLLRLQSLGRAIFVGDTHGDFDATINVVGKYLGGGNKLIFLGDYVDRGERSRENINFLSILKLTHPRDVFLLMGNHEAYTIVSFSPANFWETLDPELRSCYGDALCTLPLAVSTENGVLALHGALPDVDTLDDINDVRTGSKTWRQITWGDFRSVEGEYLGDYGGRPQFGEDYFTDIMSRFGKKLLIRSHQPMTPVLYQKRCLTIFTSHAYIPVRSVAIVDLECDLRTVDDLVIEEI
jgi:hypothetical protein